MNPSTCYHTDAVKAFIDEARGRVPIDLSEAGLLGAARQETGLDRFGDENFLPPLRRFLLALDTEANINAYGRMHARMNLMNSLKNRLWANACFEAHPEILEREIVAPVVIMGHPRSGTTRLQRLMATDQNWEHLSTWEGMNPAPRLRQADLGKADRREEIVQRFQMLHKFNGGADIAHPMNTDFPEEELIFLRHAFSGLQAFGSYAVPKYYQWFLEQDRSDAYEYMVKMLKLVSWSRGEPSGKTWLLKCPQHMLDPGLLMNVLPDAKLVTIFRDPVRATTSTMSLMWLNSVQATDLPCREAMKDIWIDCCEQMARRYIAGRENIPVGQLHDVLYDDMNSDWHSVMLRIYSFCGSDLTPAAEQAMSAWLADSEAENRHSGHRYKAEDFGTSIEEISQRMMFYREKYGIPYERKG